MGLSQIIIEKIFVMFLLSLVGFVCAKIGMIDVNTNKRLSTLALKLVTPMLILSSYQMEYDAAVVKNLGITFAFCAMSYAVQIAAAFLLVPKRKEERDNARLERLCLIFANCGFFGIPLVEGLYGAEGTVYMTSMVAVFNMLLWAVGVPILVGKTSWKQVFKNIFSPATVATLLGLLLLLLKIRLPEVVMEPIRMIGSMNTPFAMVVAGATIAGTKLLPAFKSPRAYYILLAKMLIVPAIGVLIYRLIPAPTILRTIQILAMSCPVAAACPMLAVLYDKDEAFASQMFAITTLLSIVTIPLLFYFSVYIGV